MITERVLQAIEADSATGTNGLGLPGGGPALGEEQLGVDSQTVGPLLPATLLLGHSPKQLVHGALQGKDAVEITAVSLCLRPEIQRKKDRERTPLIHETSCVTLPSA